jgi:outer membrane lipoprotein SlyB
MNARLSLLAAPLAATLLVSGCYVMPVQQRMPPPPPQAPQKAAPVYSPRGGYGQAPTDGSYNNGYGQPAYGDAAYARYGTVRSIDLVSARQSTSGGGAIAGLLIGAVIGRQMGGTHAARDAATAVGAVGGALIGNEVEKNNTGRRDGFRVTVDLDGGGSTTLLVPDAGGLAIGERVRVDGNRIQRL